MEKAVTLACCYDYTWLSIGLSETQTINESAEPLPESNPTNIEPTLTVEPTETTPPPTTKPTITKSPSTPEPTIVAPTPGTESVFAPLPERSNPRTKTTGSVPYVQLDVEPVEAVNNELYRRAFALPDVEDRPTIVSLPGTRGMWLSDEIPLANPQTIVNGREFAHIHPDGSLHLPLPYDCALEAFEKGWAERHPWADQEEGWEGLVMLFTPQSMDELDVTFQLLVESYNHVTGRTVQALDFYTGNP